MSFDNTTAPVWTPDLSVSSFVSTRPPAVNTPAVRMEHREPTLRLVERYLRESRMVREEVIDQEAERVVAQVERTLGDCEKVTAIEFKRSALRLATERMDAIATGVLPSVVPLETPAKMAEAEEVRAVCWLRPRFWSGLATQRFTQSGIARVGSSVRPSLTDE